MLTARISEEDADFLAQLSIDGSKTPSDKIRAIISAARQRSEFIQDYPGCVAIVNEMLEPAILRIRQLELDERTHSELVSRLIAWLPDVVAFSIAGIEHGKEKGQDYLHLLENGLADRIFLLLESMLRMGVTTRCSCYDPNTIQSRLDSILDLVAIINSIRNSK